VTNAQMEGAATFPGLVDLAAERLGGRAVWATDEFFAPKENLLKPGRGVFIPDKYTDHGKWMDGWETRRKRSPEFDWCIVQLGVPGIIGGLDIDTNHFLGNHPPYASVYAVCIDGDVSDEELAGPNIPWTPLLERSPLKPGSQNLFAIHSPQRWTHLRLNIFPDGGVARFRVFGDVVPHWEQYRDDEVIDLVAVEHGGKVLDCSDMFFSPKENLIMPGRGINMGDGWETRRRRGPGYDWVVLQLGHVGEICKVEVDTAHFKGNYPDRCSLDACYSPQGRIYSLTTDSATWYPLMPEMKLQADTRHIFEEKLNAVGPVTHVRLNIFPDGGVSRLRLYGTRTVSSPEPLQEASLP